MGASVALVHEGETVVDLWGGVVSERTRDAWKCDRVSLVFSATKGITALVANVLIDRGLLDPWQPVAAVWPEFATNGKEQATVRMMPDHTVGVPALRETAKPGGFLDWDYMCDVLGIVGEGLVPSRFEFAQDGRAAPTPFRFESARAVSLPAVEHEH